MRFLLTVLGRRPVEESLLNLHKKRSLLMNDLLQLSLSILLNVLCLFDGSFENVFIIDLKLNEIQNITCREISN